MSEFSRILRLDALREAAKQVDLSADEAERAALARRFGLAAIRRLEAEAEVSRRGEVVIATGCLRAAVTQSCAATGDPVEATVEEPFSVEFRPMPAGAADEEIELGEDELDVHFYEGAAIDLGEAVAQSLTLALDPYPRAPGAEAALREAGVVGENEAKGGSSPFAALAALKDKMGP